MTDMSMRNDPGADLESLVRALQDSLTDGMVERLASTAGNTLEVVDRLNDEDTREAVLYIINRVTELHRLGALETLFQMVTLVHGVREAMTDGMVERLFAFMEHTVNNLANENVSILANHAGKAMSEAAKASSARPPSGGLMSTISLLSKPESQQALHFLLDFAGKMQAYQHEKTE
jgi:uncharacterized protein YjgD (DUF1641 family)